MPASLHGLAELAESQEGITKVMAFGAPKTETRLNRLEIHSILIRVLEHFGNNLKKQ